MELILGALVVLTAYFIKGFTGFGPALIMVPLLTILYDPVTAIIVTTLLDLLAGVFLSVSVRKDIQWRFVLSVFMLFSIGAFAGSSILGKIPTDVLKQVIGVTIIVFSSFFLINVNTNRAAAPKWVHFLRYPVSLLSGFMGGFLSISGPPLVIYMKLIYQKSFFRAQLIAIFLLGAGWRLLLYLMQDLESTLSMPAIFYYILIMIISLYFGNRISQRVNEIVFNRTVAILLLLPALNLLFG